MPRLCCLLLMYLLMHHSARAVTVLTFQPDGACGEDACVFSLWPDNNYATHHDFIACAWTNQGNPVSSRALINFDLSVIPAGATIVHAQLELFHYQSPSNVGHSNLSGPANAWLERIIQPWSETGVTWNNQPATSIQNRVNVMAPAITTQSYTITVTALVLDMLANPLNSHGFMLRQQTEVYYRSLLFGSSDNPYAALRPKLVVRYAEDTLPSAGCWTSVVISPNNPNPAPPPQVVDPVVTMPNIFTPDNDGHNDFFFADTSAGATITSFLIFNRWGNVVYESADGQPWDGNTNGNPCSDGTYYYLLEYSANQKVFVMKGFVVLLR